ncbi:SRPBCC family protein [Chryseolinea lacunae]|uniref:SRPBCC family protein n=1 Tax=Chryseolinea lacunae TaxID=2801331 RepID=A0ABS1L0R6_9BACT|nr:SRPBCC family protein [Chryseolinea lacunae]MBL0745175.1 SRPBCC family protein [Chryseolinea lacunae]
MLKKILVGVGVVVVLIIVVGFLQPGTTTSTRKEIIHAPPEAVFAEINNLRQWPAWSWWMKNDPSMTLTFGTPAEGANAFYTWISDDGDGKLTIEESVPFQYVKTAINFTDFGTAHGTYTLEATADGTVLTMDFSYENGMNPLVRLMSALMIKPEVSKAFEYELSTLKKIAEAKQPTGPSS